MIVSKRYIDYSSGLRQFTNIERNWRYVVVTSSLEEFAKQYFYIDQKKTLGVSFFGFKQDLSISMRKKLDTKN